MVIWGWGWNKTLNILTINPLHLRVKRDSSPNAHQRALGDFFGIIFLGLTCLAPASVWSHGNQSLDVDIFSEANQSAAGQSEVGQSAADQSEVDQSGVSQSKSIEAFPLKVGGDFELIDHHGELVTKETYKGKHMLVFFGYINCKNMCSISLARIGKALALLGDSVNKLNPVVITVDPDRDTPEAMKLALNKFHPNFIGLTGKPDKLQAVYQNYKQQPTWLGNDGDNDSIISHSSYIYLMDTNGDFATLFPPALNPERMADIIRKYIDGAA